MVDCYEHKSAREIFERANEAIGKTFKDIAAYNHSSVDKGAVGKFIEKYWFGIDNNSRPEPDFPKAGIELKVIPYEIKKGILKAKERLACNMIDYKKEVQNDFETSSFWKKCHKMLVMTYKYDDEIAIGDYSIDHVFFWPYSNDDYKIIRCDYYTIINKIKSGEAHLISEKDTTYLAANTKGKNKNDMKEQPYSDIPAKSRAFSLKKSYVTEVLNRIISNENKGEPLNISFNNLGFEQPIYLEYNEQPKFDPCDTFENRILRCFFSYYGISSNQICQNLSIDPRNLSLGTLYLFISRIFCVDDIVNTNIFLKAGISIDIVLINDDKPQHCPFRNPYFTEKILSILFEYTWDGWILKKAFFIPIEKED